ncbi:hypothetical protein RHMOL_Rhmol04G0246000 [Rhododendron molle]|uniref:Uncharacterized protein n=1 Tax=Rhododendron molle TaxID=49168 RepID=A0ACC0P492_RHOML|nr:hypothetical protein RHMOL_Rhmol04G0246000 [Rhododendron molle]
MKSTVPNDDHLLITDTDGPAAQQIKELSAEVNMLRRELMAKGFPSKPSPVAPSSTTIAGTTIAPTGKLPSPTPWKDMVTAESPVISHMNLHYCLPTVVNDKLCVNILEGAASSGVDRWKDWIVGYFVDRKLSFTAVSTIAQNLWGMMWLVLLRRLSVVADRAVERIPTVGDIKKKAGIDGAASLKVLYSLVSSSGTKAVNRVSLFCRI